VQSEVGRVVGSSCSANSKEGLQKEGQLGGIDLNLTSQLVDAQTNLRALTARDSSMAQTQQELRSQINRFPVLAEYNTVGANQP